MNEKKIIEKIQNLRKVSKKRNFVQTFDLIINLKNLDLRNSSNKLELGVLLDSNMKSKKLKICAVVDQSISNCEEIFDKVLYVNDLSSFKSDIKSLKKITHGYDKFVVQVNHMAQFAQVFGKYLGPMNKMPSPKLGMIITPKTNLSELSEKIQKMFHIQIKKNLVIQGSIGYETLKNEEVARNVMLIYNSLIGALPNREFNIESVNLKLTMSRKEKL